MIVVLYAYYVGTEQPYSLARTPLSHAGWIVLSFMAHTAIADNVSAYELISSTVISEY